MEKMTDNMTPIDAIHTFARHYCIDQFKLWAEQEDILSRDFRGAKPEPIYPHRLALEAILEEVERKTPVNFATASEIVEWLLLVGQTAESFSTITPIHQTGSAKQMIDEERIKFCDALRQFIEKENWSVVPLPYRRTLDELESRIIWNRMIERWDISGECWYPLREVNVPHRMLAMSASVFLDGGRLQTLHLLLAAQGVDRVWEVWECVDDRATEIELALFKPFCSFSEGYWTSENMDWLIYASHESSVTLAGDRLVAGVKSAWTDWETYLLDTPWLKPSSV